VGSSRKGKQDFGVLQNSKRKILRALSQEARFMASGGKGREGIEKKKKVLT